MKDGFLFEPGPVEAGAPWQVDVAWEKANDRGGHEYTVRATGVLGSIAKCRTIFARVTPDFLRDIIYGDPCESPVRDRPIGLSTYFGTRNANIAANAVNVLDGAGSNNLTSIWLLAWSLRTIYIATRDGEPPLPTEEAAFVLADWRAAVRIANVDALGAEPLIPLLTEATLFIPSSWRKGIYVRPIFWMNADVRKRLKDEGVSGNVFRDIPIRTVDQLHNQEPRID